ncbi:MAG: Ig-like domain-containing protein, partial [Holophagaceae bacterium]|nr:Ig-like domain-containing protein [Holophagaceae bacterium]
TLNKTSTSILEGSTETLTATIVPANATNKAVSWASNNINVATVNADGLVTGVAAGSATITVVTQDGNHQASCVVTVDTVSIPVTGLTLNKNSAILTVGGADILIATLQPSNATNKTITWTTSDSGVATVNNGSVTAYGTGTAIITATAQGSGQKAYCDVTVRPTPGYVPKIYAAGNFGLAEHDETFQNNRITMNDELYSVFATGNGNVYTAGWSDGAAYWRNSVRYYLNATGDSEAYSIFVANGNEYVAGEQSYGSTYEASLWKNGQVRPLNVNTGYGSWANSVFVYDDVEYVAGVQRAGSDVMYPTLWVNGQAQHYGPGVSTDANAYSVYVRGNIPYVAGWIGDDGYYWVDGVAHRLQRSRSWVEAYSIFVADNGDVYVAGCEDWLPTVWRNGNLLYRLSFDYSFANYTQGYATSIFVYNGDVYVAGSCYDYDFDVYDAYIWKNGDWFSYWYDDYANENKMFYSIFVK